jgi:hypothetical protein
VSAYLQLTITDTLGVWVNGDHAINPMAKVTRTFWYRLPEHWVAGGALSPDRRQHLINRLYGPGWREGNPDGSRFVILDLQEKVLSAREARAKPWLSDRAGFFVLTDDDLLREVIPAEL